MKKKNLIGSGTCPLCGNDNRVDITDKEMTEYLKWNESSKSTCLQDAMPTLSSTKREIIISGICEICQDRFFNIEEENDPFYKALDEDDLYYPDDSDDDSLIKGGV